MKRTPFILLAMLTLASCSRMQDVDVPDAAQDTVGFDVYTRSTVSTKAGFTGDIDEASFKVAGFGVYAYVSTTPDFMRNQHVTYSGGSWVYSPVKYWPNQDTDKISFYAYGPHVSSAPYTTAEAAITNANNEEGILYIPGTDATGDPVIVYKTAADPSNNVDLMFGVAAEDHASPDVTAGLPFLSMTKLMLGEKMKFNFKHALTKLVVNVDGYFDEENSGSAGNHEVDANTRIVVESVSISTDRLATYGTLNLKNTEVNTPKWELGATPTTLSVYPLPVASNLLYIDGNETSVVHFSQQPLGVTKTKQSLMGYGIDGTTAASLMFVPNGAGTGNLDVTIVYHVITRDSRLETGYNDVRNSITKTITGLAGNAFKPGYLTTLNLHLGLASVKFDAVITNWTTGETESVDLPENTSPPVFSISSGRYVEISRCNLQATTNNFGETWKWHLAAHPYDVADTYQAHSHLNGNGTVTVNGSIDRFGWSTAATYYGINPSINNDDYSGEFKEWTDGNDIYVSSGSDESIGSDWRILTINEWAYLLGDSEERNQRFGLGRIDILDTGYDYVYGLFILPDNHTWSDPKPNQKTFSLGFLDSMDSRFTGTNQYNMEEWEVLDASGVVFLPWTGYRWGTNITWTSVCGDYWSSTHAGSDSARKLRFTSYLSFDNSHRCSGCSVRLVRDIN